LLAEPRNAIAESNRRIETMKIVCESCGAKYSIADERVTGKVFKIRCKRCSEVIIVRGDQQAQPDAEQASAGGSIDQTAIWHVVVDGEQAGPYAPSQLADMLSAGTVDWEAYVWAEGFDNWLPMRDVPDLVSQITGQGAAQQQQAAEPRAAAYRSVNQTLAGQPSMGADPFAEDAAAGDGGLFGGAAAASPGPDLFGRSPATAASSPFAAGPDSGVLSSSPTPRADVSQAMTGARNENSVLFSLKNLQALATGSGTSLPPATAGNERAGYAGGEGSGLIDIRALATATGVSENSEGAGARDELLSIGSQGGAFGTLGSPMLSPVGDDGEGNKKVLVWALVAVVGFLSMAAVAIIYIMRAPSGPAQPVAVAPAAPNVGVVAAAQAPAAVLPGSEPPSEGALLAAAKTKDSKDDDSKDDDSKDDDSSERRAGDRSPRRRSAASDTSSGKSTASASDPSPSPAEKREAPAKPSGPKSIDDLLDGALSGSAKTKAPAASTPNPNLPDQPSRDQVISAMNSVKSAVSNCAPGQGGVATVTVSVAGETGRVTNAQVSGVTGPAGSCVAKAVRRAQFPKFKNKVFKIQFPFKL
jgi:predicted Zn finger-like uncharacterized protein